MSIPTTPRAEGAAVDFALNATLTDLSAGHTKMEALDNDVVKRERTVFNSILLVLVATLAMIVNVGISRRFRPVI